MPSWLRFGENPSGERLPRARRAPLRPGWAARPVWGCVLQGHTSGTPSPQAQLLLRHLLPSGHVLLHRVSALLQAGECPALPSHPLTAPHRPVRWGSLGPSPVPSLSSPPPGHVAVLRCEAHHGLGHHRPAGVGQIPRRGLQVRPGWRAGREWVGGPGLGGTGEVGRAQQRAQQGPNPLPLLLLGKGWGQGHGKQTLVTHVPWGLQGFAARAAMGSFPSATPQQGHWRASMDLRALGPREPSSALARAPALGPHELLTRMRTHAHVCTRALTLTRTCTCADTRAFTWEHNSEHVHMLIPLTCTRSTHARLWVHDAGGRSRAWEGREGRASRAPAWKGAGSGDDARQPAPLPPP